jgi:hypothetical protein
MKRWGKCKMIIRCSLFGVFSFFNDRGSRPEVLHPDENLPEVHCRGYMADDLVALAAVAAVVVEVVAARPVLGLP